MTLKACKVCGKDFEPYGHLPVGHRLHPDTKDADRPHVITTIKPCLPREVCEDCRSHPGPIVKKVNSSPPGTLLPDDDEPYNAHFMNLGGGVEPPYCDQCGALTTKCEKCYRCFNCGNSMGDL